MWPFSQKRIYLDYAAATPVCDEAARAYARAARLSGNPGASHKEGREAKRVLDDARASIARELAVKPREIIFTSGSTEANNFAIVGYAQQLLRQHGSLTQTHWIVSAIEHPSVLESFGEVERLGGMVTHITPDASGRFSAEVLTRSMRPETVFMSIGWGNHEIGVLQPLRTLSRASSVRAEELGIAAPIFHTDMGQAPLYKVPHVHTLGVDLAVIGSGKVHGPRGIAALYLSNRVQLAPQSFGGGQERELRAGTESPALATGFAAALDVARALRETESLRLSKLRDTLVASLRTVVPQLIENTPVLDALPHILNISLPGANSEYLVLALDKEGIAVSTKSACNAGETASHVVAALGVNEDRATSTIRFSLGRATTERDIHRAAAIFSKIVSQNPHAIVAPWISSSSTSLR